MGEDNDFIDFIFFYNLMMFSDSTQVFEVTFLFKWSDVSDYVDIPIIRQRVFEFWFAVIHDEEDSFFWEPSMLQAITTEYPDDDAFEQYSADYNKKGIDEDKSGDEYSFIRESVGHIEHTDSDEKTHKN